MAKFRLAMAQMEILMVVVAVLLLCWATTSRILSKVRSRRAVVEVSPAPKLPTNPNSFIAKSCGGIPTVTFCEEYSRMHSVDFEFLIDQIGATHTIAPAYPYNLVIDAEGRVVHEWEFPLPEDKLEILTDLLDAAQ